MRKMIHEELAGAGDLEHLADLLGIRHIGASSDDLWRMCMSVLAERIARDYIPRLRYEDVRSVQFGEEVELRYKAGGHDKGILQAIHVNKGPVWLLSLIGCDHERWCRYDSTCDVLRSPAPKPLSADGKELEDGMTVWVTPEHRGDCGKGHAALGGMAGLCGYEYGEAVEVRRVVSGCNVMLRTKSRAWCPASWLTTEEPDTLEKLRDDMAKYICGYMLPNDPAHDEAIGWKGRIDALIERGA